MSSKQTNRNSRKNILTRAAAILALLTAGMTGTAMAQSGTYTTPNGGVWSDSANWTGAVIADGVDNTASFEVSITGNSDSASLDSVRTIGNIAYTDTNGGNNDWTLDNNGNLANILMLDVTSGPATITANSNHGRLWTLDLVIAGSDDIVKDGAGRIRPVQDNTYTGTTTVEQGGTFLLNQIVASGAPSAFGDSTSAIMMGNANTGTNDWDVEFSARLSQVARDITFVNTGSAGSASLRLNGSSAELSGTVTLDRDITIFYGEPGSGGEISGLITGTGGFTRDGGGETLFLTDTANDFSGQVIIDRGAISFSVSGTDNALGGTSNTTDVVIPDGHAVNPRLLGDGTGTFSRNVIVGDGSGTVNIGTDSGHVTYTGTVSLNDPDNAVGLGAGTGDQVTFAGLVQGVSDIFITGASSAGQITRFTNPANTFTGDISTSSSTIAVGADSPLGGPGALGSGTGAISIGGSIASGLNPGGIIIEGAFTVGRPLNLVGLDSASNWRGTTTIGGTTADESRFLGDVSVEPRFLDNVWQFTAATGGETHFDGQLSGTGDLRKINNGDVYLHGDNSGWSGETFIQRGTLVVAHNDALGTSTNPVEMGDNLGGSFIRGLDLTNNVTLNRDVTLSEFTNFSQEVVIGSRGAGTVNTLTGDINLDRNPSHINTLQAIDASTFVLTGSIVESAANALRVQGDGYVDLRSDNTYSGGTTILSSGTLLANNTIGSATGSGDIAVSSTGTLGGNGFVDGAVNVASGGTIAPGNSVGNLTVNNDVFYNSGSTQALEILAQAVGFDFDVLTVNGTVTLNNANLDITLTTPVQKWQKLFIVVNDRNDAVLSEYLGKPNGSSIVLTAGNFARISYFGDSGAGTITGGNDIVLYDFTTNIPEPATMTLLALGGLMLGRRQRNGRRGA